MATVYLTYGVGIGAGTLVLPLMVVAAVTLLYWRDAMRVTALAVLLLGLAAALLLRRAPQASAAPGGQIAGSSPRQALRSRSFWYLYLGTVLAAPGYAAMALFALWFGLSYGGIVSLLPALCMDLFGARAVAAIIGTLYTGAALGNLLGPVLAGAVFDRFGSYAPVIWICLVLSALATVVSYRLVSSGTAGTAATGPQGHRAIMKQQRGPPCRSI